MMPSLRARTVVLRLGVALACLAATACSGGGSSAASPSPASAPPSPGTAVPLSASPPAPAAQAPPAAPSAAAASPAASPSAVGPGPAASAASPPPAAAAADWTTYHGNPARTGAAAGPFDAARVDQRWTSPALDGDVYAEPLASGGRVFVATENDSVYALDAGSGEVAWQAHLGEPVPRSAMPCGNIDPVGITSTPAIDPSSSTLFVVALLQPAHHEIVALDLATGTVRYRQPIDPPGADPLTHLNRAALSLFGGSVYVPFGGRFGDCGAYHGWVVAAKASDGTRAAVYQVPSQREGAIWATSGATIDSAGNLYVATGNAESASQFDFGNAVVKLSPSLQVLDWFAPSDWSDLSRRDQDLGSTGPVLLDDGSIFQIGKTGTGYLLRSDHLGQIGGEVFQASVCRGAYGSLAYASSLVFVPCRDGLIALRMGQARFDLAWRGPQTNANSPIVVGDAVWTIDPGSGSLLGYAVQDGSAVFKSQPVQAAGSLPHFITPGFGGGRLLVARGRTVAAFGPG